MSGNVDTYPKTVNLNSSLPVNFQMKRIVKSNCHNGMTPKCIKKSYDIPIAGKQNKYKSKLDGMTTNQYCVGPVYNIGQLTACVTHYNGISQDGNLPGFCNISTNATARGYYIKMNENELAFKGNFYMSPGHIINHGPTVCGTIGSAVPSCQYFNASFAVPTITYNGYTVKNLLFTSVCNTQL